MIIKIDKKEKEEIKIFETEEYSGWVIIYNYNGNDEEKTKSQLFGCNGKGISLDLKST